MKRFWIILLTAIIAVSAAACGSAQEETAPATEETVATEESAAETDPAEDQETAPYIESQGDFPIDLIGKWGEPIELGLIINIREDGTLSAYHLNEEDPDGELLYFMDGSWHVEGQEVCISINGVDRYYSYDEGTGMLIDRDGAYFYALTDKGLIP